MSAVTRFWEWLLGGPDPTDDEIAAARADSLATRDRIVARIVGEFLDRDDVIDALGDWLTNVYDDPDPPLIDLLTLMRNLGEAEQGEQG